MNLHPYDYYDPDWHRFTPTQDEVLTDAQLENRRRRLARGLGRMARRLPWPLLVIPPFVAKLWLPLAALALILGAFTGPEPPRGPGGRVGRYVPPSIAVTITGPAVLGTSTSVSAARAYGQWTDEGTVRVTNHSDEDVLVWVKVDDPAGVGLVVAYQLAPRLVRARMTEALPILMCKTRKFRWEPLTVRLETALVRGDLP